ARLRPELSAVARVRDRHLDPARAVAADAPLDLDGVPGLLGEQRRHRVGLRHRPADENFPRRLAAAAVVLKQESANDLVAARTLRDLREVVAAAERAAG